MERITFLIEESGERLSCLLNPNSVVMRRTAGVQARRVAGGQLVGAGLSDDPLLHTGGGRTEIELELLFDIGVAGSSIEATDVRDLTRPLWQLAENAVSTDGYGTLPVVRFVWGKAWNIPGIVAAVAERLEQFNEGGEAQRSWLHLRLLRTAEPIAQATRLDQPALDLPDPEEMNTVLVGNDDLIRYYEARGDGSPEGGERLDLLADLYLGDAAFWRRIATFNDIDDPLHVQGGTVLQIPPPTNGGRTP